MARNNSELSHIKVMLTWCRSRNLTRSLTMSRFWVQTHLTVGRSGGQKARNPWGRSLWSLYHRMRWGKHSLQRETNTVIQKLHWSATLTEHWFNTIILINAFPINKRDIVASPNLYWYAVCVSHSVVPDSSATPWTVARQAPLPTEFSKHKYWSVLPFPSPGDLPNPGIKPRSPALAGRLF